MNQTNQQVPLQNSQHVPSQAPAQAARAAVRSTWGIVDGALDGLPWYVTLGVGVGLGIFIAKKMGTGA
jgi:hypothetical protein